MKYIISFIKNHKFFSIFVLLPVSAFVALILLGGICSVLLYIIDPNYNPNDNKYLSAAERCKMYTEVLKQNTESVNGVTSPKIDCKIYKLYKDSLNMAFNELSNDEKILMWDKYLNSDTISRYAFCANINTLNGFNKVILNTLPEEYDWMKYGGWEDNIKNLLSSHNFDPSTLDYSYKDVSVSRKRVWESIYDVYVKIKYKNLFNASVCNTIHYKIHTDGSILSYDIY